MTSTAAWAFRDGRAGRVGVLFAAIWLVFLATPYQVAWQRASSGPDRWAGVVGLLALTAFAACYLAAFAWVRARRQRLELTVPAPWAALVLGALVGLMVIMCLALGQVGTAGTVYVAVTAVMLLPTRQALVAVLALAAANEVTARVVTGWTEQAGLTFAACTAGFAMWGVQQLMLRNADLLQAREENARLAVADERNRFARDLHDILGHSLDGHHREGGARRPTARRGRGAGAG